jgi:threonine synthase
MILYNINDKSERVSLEKAVLGGQPDTPGLYMPVSIPVLPSKFFDSLKNLSLREIAFDVIKAMMGDDLPDNAIHDIVGRSLDFSIPLVNLTDDLHVLELTHGPTLAFKDVGARFMSALFEYLLRNKDRETTVLVATSGDTGSAVANAFLNKKGIKVVILFPSGRVSKIQELMLTTVGGNVTAVEVDGDFDACQKMVKEAFLDRDLTKALNLTSANSINFGRLFPQSFYYFYAISQLNSKSRDVVISVPSGNFGNLTAGAMALKMGLGIDKFIASNNENHAVAEYLKTGIYKTSDTKATLSNAMDVGNPSNFPRLLELFSGDHSEMSRVICGYWFNDEQTLQGIDELYDDYGYVVDPHGAVAYLGLKEYRKRNKADGIFLETAHPVKFISDGSARLNARISVPGSLNQLSEMEQSSVRMSASFPELKRFLLD